MQTEQLGLGDLDEPLAVILNRLPRPVGEPCFRSFAPYPGAIDPGYNVAQLFAEAQSERVQLAQ